MTETTKPMSEQNELLQAIIKCASDPTIEISRMERLIEIHDKMLKQQSEQDFNIDMCEVQSKITRIIPNAHNPQFRKEYATYDQIDRNIRPIYTEHGFSLSFNAEQAVKENDIRIVCVVSHKNGFSRKYQLDMPADGAGAKGGTMMSRTHAMGSANTYAKRYLVGMIFNLSCGGDPMTLDDDGNAASEPIPDGVLKALVDIRKSSTMDELNKKWETYLNILRGSPEHLAIVRNVCKEVKSKIIGGQ